MVAIALFIRAGWALKHSGVIEQEGAEYARIAQNLLAGHGYVGLFDNGPALAFPPLFPLLIAALSLVTGNAETAARVINVLAGALLVIPCFKLADELYGPRVARIVAGLVALHPALIAGGASTYAEGLHLTLLMAGLVWLRRWSARRTVSAAVLAGGLLGLAYLVRPEAGVIAIGAVVVWLVAALASEQRLTGWRPGAGFIAAFLLVVFPYVLFLSTSTGQFRIQALGSLAYQWSARLDRGMPHAQAAAAIGSNLEAVGVDMHPNVELLRATNPSAGDYVRLAVRQLRRAMPALVASIGNSARLGSPWLLILVILGLFRAAWDFPRWKGEGLLLLTAAVLLAGQALWFRECYSLLGILLVWGGKGADELGEWCRDTADGVGARKGFVIRIAPAMSWASIGLVLLLSYRGSIDEARYAARAGWQRVEAGRWLAAQRPAAGKIMDSGSQIAFYAQADLIFLPYAAQDLALGYIALKQPGYIVLTAGSVAERPYTSRWFADGIPDPRAELVYDAGLDGDERVRIFRWRPAAPTPESSAQSPRPTLPEPRRQ